jgi:hypothetical protein
MRQSRWFNVPSVSAHDLRMSVHPMRNLPYFGTVSRTFFAGIGPGISFGNLASQLRDGLPTIIGDTAMPCEKRSLLPKTFESNVDEEKKCVDSVFPL